MQRLLLTAAAGLLGMGLIGGAAQAQTVPLTYSQALSPQEVQMVQQQLRQFGVYSGAIDGQWGPDSVIALQRFQQQHGIQPSGQLNEGTVASLGLNPGILLGGPPPPATAMTPPPAPAYAYQPAVSPRGVAAVQDRLRQLGYYRGNVDGVWGAETQNALQQFQQGHGLQPDAQLNPITLSALGLNPGWVYARR
jgi:peptidoglycan hydrolase-like protein with peptidoglycan-binding domain